MKRVNDESSSFPKRAKCESKVTRINSAFKTRLATYKVESTHHINIELFLKECSSYFPQLVSSEVKKHGLIKVNCELFGEFILPPKEVTAKKSFNTKFQIIDASSDLNELYVFFCGVMEKKLTECQVGEIF